MPKKQSLSLAKLKQLSKIKNDENLIKNITSFHQKWGKGFTIRQIYNKWYYLSKRVLTKSSRTHVSVQSSKIKPYILEKGVIITARGDQKLKEEVMKKIKPSLLAMGVRAGTLPIYTTDVRAFKDLVKEPEFNGMVFGTTKIPENKKMVRIYRKM